ncbi:MAG: RNA 2',3'-cyclic phosphodiesterase [Acetivibrionales bacterium]|jgi:2'-5' RNA ligase
MRSFIAIDFSREMKNSIRQLQNEIRELAVSGRWKYVDNFHLTIKFLDEIDLKKAALIGKELTDICSRTSSFTLKMGELGFFPGNGCIRVLWLGLEGDVARLIKLQKNVEIGMGKLGFKMENREYKPHVTIGQNILLVRDFNDIKKKISFEKFPLINVDRIYLFSSEQIGRKRVYSPINEFLFNTNTKE